MLTLREVICSQYPHCLSCPLSVQEKDCRELSPEEIRKIMRNMRTAMLTTHITSTSSSSALSVGQE